MPKTSQKTTKEPKAKRPRAFADTCISDVIDEIANAKKIEKPGPKLKKFLVEFIEAGTSPKYDWLPNRFRAAAAKL